MAAELPCWSLQSCFHDHGGAGNAKKSRKRARATPDSSLIASQDSVPVAPKKSPAKRNQTDGALLSKDFSPFYLMKNEPDDFSIDDLASEPSQRTCWGAPSFSDQSQSQVSQQLEKTIFSMATA
jgi:hypothetical protein